MEQSNSQIFLDKKVSVIYPIELFGIGLVHTLQEQTIQIIKRKIHLFKICDAVKSVKGK